MRSIRTGSAKVEQEPTAQANKFGIPTSADNECSVSESGGVENAKIHGFSKRVAEYRIDDDNILGWKAALILRFLSNLQHNNGKMIDGKRWIRIKLDTIADQYVYCERTSVGDAVDLLKKVGACLVENRNRAFGKPKYDRTNCFHIPKKWMDLAEEDVRYFNTALAKEVGVPAAVIDYNFSFWIKEARNEGRDPVVDLAPASLRERLPFPGRSIKRALKKLVDLGRLFPVKIKRCCYTDKPTKGPQADEIEPNADMGGPNPDKVGPKPDNDSIESIIVESLKDNSKSQAEPVTLNFFSCVKEADPTRADDIMPSADEQDTKDASTAEESSCSPLFESSFPEIEGMDFLHHANQQLAPQITGQSQQAFAHHVHGRAWSFFKSLDEDVLLELYRYGTDEEVFQTVIPEFRLWFSKAGIPRESALFDFFYFGVLECVVGALVKRRLGDGFLHPVRCLRQVAYSIYLELYRRDDARREQEVAAEFAERRTNLRSIDREKENDSSLSPAEKTRVFKQGLNAMNRVGWICLGGILKTDCIKITKDGLTRVQKLFDQNRALTPRMLLNVMEKCIALHSYYPPVSEHYAHNIQKWHARRATSLAVFARYLPTILEQLNIDSQAIMGTSEFEDDEYEEAA